MQLDPHNQLIMKFTWVCIMILSPSNNISQGIGTISPFCYMARWRCMIFSEKIKLCSKLPEPSYHEFAQHHKMMHIRIIQSESNGNIQEGKKLDVLRSVGTPGLGYPLLLCLGKSLVVILDYVQNSRTPAVRSPVHPTTAPDPFPGWERSGSTTWSRRSARTAGGSRPPVEVLTPTESRTPHGVPDPLYSNRTPH